MDRITRTQYFNEQVKLVARRSTCARGQVGAIIVVDKSVVATGYAGSPRGHSHCLDVGCLIIPPSTGCQRTVHAEQNAVAFAARHGIRTEGAHLYSTMSPCLACAKLLVNSGITEVYFLEQYRDSTGTLLLLDSGIACWSWHGEADAYKPAEV